MEELDGIHHISAITADATNNLLFYEGVMGLRLVKKTVNQDNPSVYHLFYSGRRRQPWRRPYLFRVPRPGPWARRRRDDPHHRDPGRFGGRTALRGQRPPAPGIKDPPKSQRPR